MSLSINILRYHLRTFSVTQHERESLWFKLTLFIFIYLFILTQSWLTFDSLLLLGTYHISVIRRLWSVHYLNQIIFGFGGSHFLLL